MEFACWQQVIRMMDKLQVEPIDPASTSAHDFSAEQRELQAGLQKLWGKLQEFYLEKARVVFYTADTAGRHILRGYCPRFVLIEEASHISETTCLVPVILVIAIKDIRVGTSRILSSMFDMKTTDFMPAGMPSPETFSLGSFIDKRSMIRLCLTKALH